MCLNILEVLKNVSQSMLHATFFFLVFISFSTKDAKKKSLLSERYTMSVVDSKKSNMENLTKEINRCEILIE